MSYSETKLALEKQFPNAEVILLERAERLNRFKAIIKTAFRKRIVEFN